jgi:C4-dicarboxylate transporter DctM subunit
MFIYKELKLSDLYPVFVKSAKTSALILFVISLSAPFSWYMTTQGIPTRVAEAVLGTFGNKYMILFLMNLVLLIIGLFLETQAVILLLTPFLVPIANNLGMPLVVLGMIIVINTSVGMITPPLAVNVFVASGIAKVGPEQITYKIIPYLAVLIVLIFIFTYIPQTLTFFPTLLGLKI